MTNMTQPSVAVATDFVEVYISILAIIATKCGVIPSDQTSLLAACDDLKKSVVHMKNYVSALNQILPGQEDLEPLTSISAIALDDFEKKASSMWFKRMHDGEKLIRATEDMSESVFKEDGLPFSLFSPLRKAKMISRLENRNETYTDPISGLLDINYNILAQLRANRFQMGGYYDILKWTLSACLIPQLTLLVVLCLQFVVHRRRQAKMQKKIKRAEETHNLMTRYRMRDLQPQDSMRMVEL